MAPTGMNRFSPILLAQGPQSGCQRLPDKTQCLFRVQWVTVNERRGKHEVVIPWHERLKTSPKRS